MKNIYTLLLLTLFSTAQSQSFQKDTIKTSEGPLIITFIGHGSLMMEYQSAVIHIDPSTREADYEQLPEADLILITHHHGDHCDPVAFEAVKKVSTVTYLTALAKEKLHTGTVVKNNETVSFSDIEIEAIPAYNLVHRRDNGEFFHPKGCCNGYVLNIAGKRILLAGDTENTREMKALEAIDIAFLPMNLPYTMTPEMVADAAKSFKPKILYPYHYAKTDPAILVDLLKDEADIEVRLRRF
ncbi:MAG: MBL fold metallo-hydrolase [Fulvivirga sp.]